MHTLGYRLDTQLLLGSRTDIDSPLYGEKSACLLDCVAVRRSCDVKIPSVQAFLKVTMTRGH